MNFLFFNRVSFIGFLIPQRYVLTIMGFLALVNAYTMRIAITFAITQMVVEPPFKNDSNEVLMCERTPTGGKKVTVVWSNK